MEPARFTFVRCDHHHNHWIWSYCTKDFHGPDCNHGIRCFWVANFHALAQQCWHSSCSDIYIPLRQCLLLCLSKGETEERFVKDRWKWDFGDFHSFVSKHKNKELYEAQDYY